MAKLDFEFEQVLGSWLDRCAESLSVPHSLDDTKDDNDDDDEFGDSPFGLSRSRIDDDAARATIDQFRGMIVDNMEKLREIYRALLKRVSNIAPAPENSSADVSIGGSKSATSTTTTNTNTNTPEAIAALRHAQFLWLAFDCFVATVPLVAVPWCVSARDSFLNLLEHRLPWAQACDWCGARARCRECGPRSGDRRRQTAAPTFRRASRRTSVVVARNLAAERAARRREDDADAARRDASARELSQLGELAQRLVEALQKHKPSDGRSAVVKLEGVGLVKQEAAMQLQQAAAQLRGVGNTAGQALDVDEEYAPAYVQGAHMNWLVKDEPATLSSTTTTSAKTAQDGAPSAKAAGAAGAVSGGRREARKRPR